MAKSTRSSNRSSNNDSNARNKKLAAPKGKTTRATMIAMLLKNKGKMVSITAMKATLQKALGFSEEKALKRIKTKASQVSKWFASRDLKLVTAKQGFTLKSV